MARLLTRIIEFLIHSRWPIKVLPLMVMVMVTALFAIPASSQLKNIR